MAKFKVEKPSLIEDGRHQGVITDVTLREKPFSYADVHIKLDDTEIVLKASYPANVTENTKFGQLLIRFGAKLIPDTEIEANEVLVGKKCQFVTISEQTERGTFAHVVQDSVKMSG